MAARFANADAPATQPGDPLERCNVVWTTPSADSSGSMPLGNGDIGLNVWTQENGDVCFYISKTDAWDEYGRLVKLGRVRISLAPNPLRPGRSFSQTLRLRQGDIEIRGRSAGANALMRIWVDAHAPVIHVDMTDDFEFSAFAEMELWRTQERALQGTELHSAYGMEGAPHPVMVTPDTVVDATGWATSAPADDTERASARNALIWYHRNRSSIWPETLRLQGMQDWLSRPDVQDPLLHRTFGCVMRGGNFEAESPQRLRSVRPSREQRLRIHVLTQFATVPESWVRQALEQAAQSEATAAEQVRSEHVAWWDQFWSRSWIRVPGESRQPPATAPAAPERAVPPDVTQGYVLQRFINACGGRGAFPIKFNGSIFTVDAREPGETFDADYRRWGGPYWFQNTRLIYWPMLASGDTEMMQPFFAMYGSALPFLKARTRAYFDHDGAFFPATMYFWGDYPNSGYGWDRTGKPPRHVDNVFIRWHYNGTLELLAMMLDYHVHTLDEEFLQKVLLPMADEVLAFWAHHFPRDPGGKLMLKPAQALESYQNCVNPAPDIAGLRSVIPRLLELSPLVLGRDRRDRWGQLFRDTPALPLTLAGGQQRLAPAEVAIGGQANIENPELYAIFPFRLFGVGQAGIELARASFAARINKASRGWHQDDVEAALLGLADEAKAMVSGRFAQKHPGSRFPGFYGPNYDWVPDQDHPSVGMLALQAMLLQSVGSKLHLLAAWPRDWDVSFRLHAPRRTVVQGEFKAGKLVSLSVDPPGRAADVVLPPGLQLPPTRPAP